jgi:hypothetical protein
MLDRIARFYPSFKRERADIKYVLTYLIQNNKDKYPRKLDRPKTQNYVRYTIDWVPTPHCLYRTFRAS